jgi:5-methylcytosine-specific restriction enzyme A
MGVPCYTGRPDGSIPQHKPPPPQTESAEGRKARKKLYNSTAWQRCRALALRRSPLCPRCAENGFTTPATDVHHIQDLAEGGAPFDLDNLETLCHEHHSMVTRWRQNQRKQDDGSSRP